MSNTTQLTLNLIGTFIAIITVLTGTFKSFVEPLREDLSQISNKLSALELKHNESNYRMMLRIQDLERIHRNDTYHKSNYGQQEERN